MIVGGVVFLTKALFGSDVVKTLFGRRDKGQVALNTRLGEGIKERWNVRKVRDWLSLMG